MLKKNEVDNLKKKKKKRVIDHAKVAGNKKRAKANKAKLKKKLREMLYSLTWRRQKKPWK